MGAGYEQAQFQHGGDARAHNSVLQALAHADRRNLRDWRLGQAFPFTTRFWPSFGVQHLETLDADS